MTPPTTHVSELDPEALRASGGLGNAFIGLSLRAKLLIGGVVFQLLVIGLVFFLNAGSIKRAMQQQLDDQANQYRPLVRAAVSTALLQRDYASLQAQLAESVHARGLARIVVLNPLEKIVAQAGEPERRASEVVFDESIVVAGERLGHVQFVMSNAVSETLLADIRRRFLWVAFGMVLGSALLLSWLAKRVSAPLRRLQLASQALRNGQFDVHLKPRAGDEIGQLAINFVYVAKAIHAQVDALKHKESALSALLSEAQVRQQQLEDAIAQAQAASAAKSDFLAKMSHEIRTPMNGVLGMLDVLQQTQLNEDQRQCTDVAQRSGLALLDILNQVLDMAKIESGALTVESMPLDVAPLLNSSLSLFASIARAKGLTTELTVDPSTPLRAMGDPAKIRQILSNLLANAIKFTPTGKVSLTARLDESANQLVLEVADSGIGMNHEQLKRVFEPFVQGDNTTTRRYGGTGLGLSISTELAQAMGGSLTVRSAPGAGSRFEVRLPFVAVHEVALAQTVVGPGDASLLSGHVLIAEDNETNQLLMRRIIASLGLTCEVVSDGQQAVDVAKSKPFDAMLLDCQMPVMDGYEAARAWREHEAQVAHQQPEAKRLPIIAISADALPQQRQLALHAGMDEHLPKPVSIAKVRAVLAPWLAK